MDNKLRAALEAGEFVVTAEMIPGRGAKLESQKKKLVEAKKLYETGRIHAVSITDNPGGNSALTASAFARDMVSNNITPLLHMSCKDRNRNMLTSALYSLERSGIQNILAMTGDYPTSGWKGMARPVFDIDPVQLLEMISDMNDGLRVTKAGQTVPDEDATVEEPTHFFPGCCVSPFKYNEGELIPQYYKLDKKVHAGAQFVISQIGYDARKMQELIWYMQDAGYGHIPAIANIYILSYGAGRAMNAGSVPGVTVTDDFLAVLDEERKAEDKGKEARTVRAAKMIAIAKGLGYRGVHIGGPGITCDQVCHLLDLAAEFESRWEEFIPELDFGKEGGFYYYKEDPETGLNIHELADRPEQHYERAVQKNYGLSRFAHRTVFTPGKRLFPLFHSVEVALENRGENKMGEGNGKYRHHGFEHVNKTNMFKCMDCGDCGLYATAYVCPMTQCPKCQRNGPCGGSNDGWCEVYPGVQRCIYYRAYYRLKKYGEENTLGDWIIQPNNWTTWQTSPWGNDPHGRDNIARRERITPWREDEHQEPPFEEW